LVDALQAVAEDSARLATLQQQFELQQRTTGASGLGSPAAAAARAAQLAAREVQLQQQQSELARREQMLEHVSRPLQ
jgi:homoserine kinase